MIKQNKVTNEIKFKNTNEIKTMTECIELKLQ